MSPHLLAIPEELQIKILSCLSGASLMLCALTCKSIHNTIKVSSQLAYITQLHLDGLKYVESTMENHDYPGLIENLYRDRRAWTTLDWMNVPKLSFTLESCGTFDIGTNGFVSLANNKFTIIPLSNPDTDIVNRSRIEGRLPDTISARGLIVDLSQDLIIILENVSIISPDLTLIKFHLRSMSGNDKHPLAKQSPLEIKVHEKGTTENGVYILNNMHIVTMNDILAVQFHHAFSMHEVIPRSRYLMWNWVTSELVFDSSLHSFDLPPSPTERLGFTLLEPTLFLMTTLQDSGSIRLYRLTETGLLLHLATFHLPATIPTAKICNVSSVTVANEVHPPTSKPYIVDIDERIHDFRIKYRHACQTAHVF
ncbi:hypothetical protein BDN70DRAFT_993316 [Pholiota conissans]|uniref:F-box domain-containing protein n=1 Tax=Pholiota conissans TaxID=109636 RepID=A0A9P6D0T2_9AGAR|nr:hypothetical protein BDN70DRAFT_993316 [Pholiota conissans]